MCRVSDKLRLCSCEAGMENLKNYWEFSRYNPDEGIHVLGSMIMPAELSAKDNKFNRKLLSRLLNDGNVFDITLNPKDKDLLTLVFSALPDDYTPESYENDLRYQHGNRVEYNFVYQNGKWIVVKHDAFSRKENHVEEQTGEIVNAKMKDWQPEKSNG